MEWRGNCNNNLKQYRKKTEKSITLRGEKGKT